MTSLFMKRISAGTLLIFLLTTALIPASASAAWPGYGSYGMYGTYASSSPYAKYGAYNNANWQNTSEGMVSTSTLQQGTRHYGYNSAMQTAINALSTTPVAKIPIPVLLGVALSDITPNFGDPRDGGTRTHEGEDIMAPKDDLIVSPTDAVVTSTGNGVSAGNYVYTANPGNETFAYMHLDKFATGITVGTVLKPGDLIGYVGNTGDASSGPTHLHFEIREGQTATDPFPRLGREFTLTERITAVANALAASNNQTADAQMLVAGYRGTFLSAKAQGMTLPPAIITALGTVATLPTTGFARDLSIGSRGDDVTALQSVLIQMNTGPAAIALGNAGATGYFGALSQAALAEYQTAHGIIPSVGYFGPLTRAYLAAHPS